MRLKDVCSGLALLSTFLAATQAAILGFIVNDPTTTTSSYGGRSFKLAMGFSLGALLVQLVSAVMSAWFTITLSLGNGVLYKVNHQNALRLLSTFGSLLAISVAFTCTGILSYVASSDSLYNLYNPLLIVCVCLWAPFVLIWAMSMYNLVVWFVGKSVLIILKMFPRSPRWKENLTGTLERSKGTGL